MVAQCTVRVRLEIDVHLHQPWGPQSTVEEIHGRARRQAFEVLNAALKPQSQGDHVTVRSVPLPEVVMILVEKAG